MPEWKEEIRRRLAGLKLEPTREAAIIEELAQHLADHYAELLSGGATEAEAYRAALAELGARELLHQELRRVERPVEQEPIALAARLEALPGAQAVSRTSGETSVRITAPDEGAVAAGKSANASFNPVTPRYFETLGISNRSVGLCGRGVAADDCCAAGLLDTGEAGDEGGPDGGAQM